MTKTKLYIVIVFNNIKVADGTKALDDIHIIFLSSSVNVITGNNAAYFFLSSEMGVAPIPRDFSLCNQL